MEVDGAGGKKTIIGITGKESWGVEEYIGQNLPICLILIVSTEMDYFQRFNTFQDFETPSIDDDLRIFHKIVEKCRHPRISHSVVLS